MNLPEQLLYIRSRARLRGRAGWAVNARDGQVLTGFKGVNGRGRCKKIKGLAWGRGGMGRFL